MVWQRTGEQTVQKSLSTAGVKVLTADSHKGEINRTGNMNTLFTEIFQYSVPFLFTANRLSPMVRCLHHCHNQCPICILYTAYYMYFIQ
jgi:hypothetical protein